MHFLKTTLLVGTIAIGFAYGHPVEEKDGFKAATIVSGKRRPDPASAKLCDDLYRFTCAPGEHNDGTGVGYTRDQIQKRVDTLKEKEQGPFAESFKKVVAAKGGNPQLRRLALSALGLGDSPVCRPGAPVEPCDTALAEGLAQVALNRALPTEGGARNRFGPGRGLQDLDFLISNPKYKEVEKELHSRVRGDLLDKKALDNIKDTVFPRVQKMIVGLLEKKVKDETVRKNLVEKIQGITFTGTDCSEIGGNEDTNDAGIGGLVVPNAFYEPKSNIFKYCNGFLLQTSSVFTMVQVIAHEIAHAFDPCNITMDTDDVRFKYSTPNDVNRCEAEFPFTGLLACLRSRESIMAERRQAQVNFLPFEIPKGPDLPKLPELPKLTHPSAVTENMLENNSEDVRSPFCTRNDQIGESFADRIAAEILPDYIQQFHAGLTRDQKQIGYSNVFRGSCDRTKMETVTESWDEHPPTRYRVNRLLLAQPQIRQQMGCPVNPSPGLVNCDLSKGGP